MKSSKLSILMHPIVILLSMAIGVLIPIFANSIIPILKPIEQMYMSLLQMCVIPILITSITLSVAKLIRSNDFGSGIRKIMITFIVFLLSIGIISILICIVLNPVLKPDQYTINAVGRIMIENDSTGSTDGTTNSNESIINNISSEGDENSNISKTNDNTIYNFLVNIIPQNVFNTLSDGDTIKIVFFFILFGISLKFINKESYDEIVSLFSGANEAFQKLIDVIIYFMAIALCIFIAVQLSEFGLDIFLPLLKLLSVIVAITIIIFVLSTIVIWKSTGTSYSKQFSVLKKVIIISLATRSSYAAIPVSISALIEGFKIDENTANLIMPLGVTLCRYGSIMIFSITSIFASYLYGVSLNVQTIIIILISSILAALSTSGAPGVVAVTMISIVLTSIGIPSGAIVTILLTLLPIIDPLDTIINVYPNCAVATIIGKKKVKIHKARSVV